MGKFTGLTPRFDFIKTMVSGSDSVDFPNKTNPLINHLRSAALEGAEVWLCEAVPLMRHVCREVVAANSGLVAEKRGTEGGLLGVGGGLSMDMYCIVLYIIYIYVILYIYIYICMKQGKIMNNHDGGNTFQGYFVVRKIFDS